MALTVSLISVTLDGTTAGDVTSLEIDGATVPILADRTWKWTGTVPTSATTVAITAIAPTRTVTRLVELAGTIAPGGVA